MNEGVKSNQQFLNIYHTAKLNISYGWLTHQTAACCPEEHTAAMDKTTIIDYEGLMVMERQS